MVDLKYEFQHSVLIRAEKEFLDDLQKVDEKLQEQSKIDQEQFYKLSIINNRFIKK